MKNKEFLAAREATIINWLDTLESEADNLRDIIQHVKKDTNMLHQILRLGRLHSVCEELQFTLHKITPAARDYYTAIQVMDNNK